MDAATGLQPIVNHSTVRDRPQRRGGSGAFERAMEEQKDEAEAGAEEAEDPVRPELQKLPPASRREDGRRHVDVVV